MRVFSIAIAAALLFAISPAFANPAGTAVASSATSNAGMGFNTHVGKSGGVAAGGAVVVTGSANRTTVSGTPGKTAITTSVSTARGFTLGGVTAGRGNSVSTWGGANAGGTATFGLAPF